MHFSLLLVDCSIEPLEFSNLKTRLESFSDVVDVISAVLFIFSILGLSQQESARAGNWYFFEFVFYIGLVLSVWLLV